jgi:hypothetical protein
MRKLVAKKLSSTRKKVSNEWKKYRVKKLKILKSKKIVDKRHVIQSELDLTRQRISGDWSLYSEKKYGLIHKSPFYDFRLVKTMRGSMYKPAGYKKAEYFKFNSSYQKIYKANKGFDVNRLNSIVPHLLKDKNVKGVLVIFQVALVDTGSLQYVSEFITKELYNSIQENNETIYEAVAKKFWSTRHYSADLRFIYMRVLYAKNK